MPRYSLDSEHAEQEPLDGYGYNHNHNHDHDQRQYSRSRSRGHQQPYYDQDQQYQKQQPPYQDYQSPRQHSQRSSPTRSAHGPTAHPDSSYRRLQREAAHPAPPPYMDTAAAAAAGAGVGATTASYSNINNNNNNNYNPSRQQLDLVSPLSPPQPPAHRDNPDGGYWGQQDREYAPPLAARPPPPSNITPGADNFGSAAAGGMAGIAYSVADRNPRESGLGATRGMAPAPDLGYPQQSYQGQSQRQNQPYRGGDPYGQQPQGLQPSNSYGNSSYAGDRDSHSSLQGLGAAANSPGYASPAMRTPSRSPHRYASDVYTDDPYQGYTRGANPNLGVVNPNDIEDDGDDGLVYGRSGQRGPRTSMLSLGGTSNRSGRSGNTATAAAVGSSAAVGGVMGAVGGIMARNARGNNSPQYDAVRKDDLAGYYGGGAGGGGGRGGSTYDLGNTGGRGGPEKPSAWMASQKGNGKKWKIAIIVIVALLIIAGIVLGVLFGAVFKGRSDGSGSSGESAADDTSKNGDLNINSPEIKKLLNNKDLHKVFPGIDYTPLNTQYPDCIHNPPSQNNITRDVAVLSQLSNTIRLYGTDCNQTQMVLHAISQLKMGDTIKVWLGVWQDNNSTTNERQLDQMWDILEQYGDKPFKGVIVANEILFRKQMTTTELGTLLSKVRTKLGDMKLSLPVATSDLGDKWDASLAQVSDYIMANIHPFFGGINASKAAMWTSWFWQDHTSSFFKSDKSKNIISETGWPSQGGTDCGQQGVTSCPNGAVAGIDQLNQFMADWVCDALKNGTEYFWFEAFDEPWKVRFNTANQNWEDHWGLMDVDRSLKTGVKIPDCGGQTIGPA